MKILENAEKYQSYMVSMRRYFHENPELSDKEENTIARLGQELSRMGIEYTVVPRGGILAKIKGGKPGDKTVLLRADTDALPVTESADNLLPGGRTCLSKNPGVMHACGHDGHMAMLLGAAKVLKDIQDEIPGTVYLCFERGEESTGNSKYIFAYIEKNGIHIDTVYGTHLLATLESGKIGINDGGMMAGAMGFNVTIEGRGGHGSRPDRANSPIDCFVAIYRRLQSLRLTKVDPFSTCTYSVGSLSAGSQGNVIPDSLTFSGTMRTFDRDGAGMEFYNSFREAVDGISRAYGCKAVYNYLGKPGHAVVNDADCARFARQVIGREIGRDKVVLPEPWMASESFSRYLRQWPGVFAFLGVQNDSKGVGAAHHNRNFDIDEDVLATGAAAAVVYAVEYLKRPDRVSGGYGRKMPYSEILKADGDLDEYRELYGEASL